MTFCIHPVHTKKTGGMFIMAKRIRNTLVAVKLAIGR